MQVSAGSVLATAPGDGKPYDMVSRFFAPYYGVPEDPGDRLGPLRPDALLGQAAGQEDFEGAPGSAARRRSALHR